MSKYISFFGEGNFDKTILGNKGFYLDEMAKQGLPVPQGFTINTGAYKLWAKGKLDSLHSEFVDLMGKLEEKTERKLGADKSPLFVSVRSGAAVSMPGMMKTLLNSGATDESIKALGEEYKNPRFAYELYRQFMIDYNEIVNNRSLGINTFNYYNNLERFIQNLQAFSDARDVLCVPRTPEVQIWRAVHAIFNSWNSETAREYRKIKNIPDNLGTAVNIQRMVFGNINKGSGSAVVFSSDNLTGNSVLSGSFLNQAQGEAIVSGEKTPIPISKLKKVQPKVYVTLERIARGLEEKTGEIQDIEATWEKPDQVFILQRRSAVTTPSARLARLIRYYKEGKITDKKLLTEVNPDDISAVASLTHLNVPKEQKPFAKGEGNAQGTAFGPLLGYGDEDQPGNPKSHIMLVNLLQTECISSVKSSRAVISGKGGIASHAGVVLTGLGIPLITGCEELIKSYVNGKTETGQTFTLDSSTGEVYKGVVPVVSGKEDPDVRFITKLASKVISKFNPFYEMQSLKELNASAKKNPIFGIDAECFNASGCLLEEKEGSLEERLKKKVSAVCSFYASRAISNPLIYVDGKFDEFLASSNNNPESIRKKFVASLADKLKSQITLVDGTPKQTLSGKLKVKGVNIVPFKDYLSQGNVVIRPWAKERDTLEIARKVLNG